MTDIDYYRILGVPPTATKRAIKAAYLDLVRRLHPDRVGHGGTALFQQITEAYEHLADPEKRRAYDCSRAPKAKANPVGADRPEIWRDVEPLIPNPTSIEYGSQSQPRGYMHDLEFRVLLTPREALWGVDLPLVLPVVEDCPWCSGLGRMLLPCLRCGGRGVMLREQVVQLRIPANVPDGSVIEVPLGSPRVGWRQLRLHISVQRRSPLH